MIVHLRWFGHVVRVDKGYVGHYMLEMELPSRKKKEETVEEKGNEHL